MMTTILIISVIALIISVSALILSMKGNGKE